MTPSSPSADNTSQDTGAYVDGSIRRHVIKVSGVMIIGFFAMTLGNLVEVLYVAQVGKFELAALAFVFPVAMSLNAMTRGIGIGGAALIAQRIGRGLLPGATLAASHCFLLALMFTFSLALGGQFASTGLFMLLGAEEEVLRLAVSYTNIWFIGFPLMGLAMVSNGVIRAFGDASFPGYITVIGPLVQVLLGPLLILGWFGMTPMGLDGAAWTFVFSTGSQVLLAGWWFLVKHNRLTASTSGFVKTSRTILKVGVPAGVTNCLHPLSMVLVTWLLADFGTSVVAAFGVAVRIEAVVGMVVVAISAAVVPLVGQNWGARKFSRVHETLRNCYLSCHIWGILAAIIMASFAPFFVSLVNDDPKLVSAAVLYLYIIPLSIGFMGMVIVSTSAFNAVRVPGPALALSISRLLVVFLPLAILLSRVMGYPGVFVAIALSHVFIGVMGWLWCDRRLRREELKLSTASLSRT